MSYERKTGAGLFANQFQKKPAPPPPSEAKESSLPPRTKIICTIGPNTAKKENLKKLLFAGMNVARMNFSHGDHEYHGNVIKNLRAVTAQTRRICGLLLDTKGPEIRTCLLEGGKDVELKKGQDFTLVPDENLVGNSSRVGVAYPGIINVLNIGDTVLIDDGLIGMTVVDLPGDCVKCKINNNGMLGQRKGVNLPGVIVDLPAVTEKDKRDLLFGVEQGVDFVAASFVRKASDVLEIRQVLGEKGKKIKIISKIENMEGLDNFDAILEVSDGIMVARGDLGVEIPLDQVCIAQKMMIGRCNAAGKPVVTATQMLESMTVNPSPTRAEAGDVANAVLDGTDCVMLSGETAKGKYPTEAVTMMADICREAESVIVAPTKKAKNSELGVGEAIALGAVRTAEAVQAGLIVTLTESGRTAQLVSKYRPVIPILAVTSSEQAARQAMVNRGVFPLLVGSMMGSDSLVDRCLVAARKLGMGSIGDLAVVVCGQQEAESGMTNTLRVQKIEC